MTALLHLENVSKVYSMGEFEVHALRSVNLQIQDGEFWAIMGSSGSGKSTMLNILGCLDRPSAGRYDLDGQNVAELNDEQRSHIRLHKLGFIFQSFHLIPQLTVAENIALPLYYQGWDDEASRVRAAELAEQVDLVDRLTHRPNELSGGQCQRAAIARSMANDPAVILADEPTGNLDSETGQSIMNLLADLNRRGRTIVMVTHEPDIATFASRHLHMKDGRIDRIEENVP